MVERKNLFEDPRARNLPTGVNNGSAWNRRACYFGTDGVAGAWSRDGDAAVFTTSAGAASGKVLVRFANWNQNGIPVTGGDTLTVSFGEVTADGSSNLALYCWEYNAAGTIVASSTQVFQEDAWGRLSVTRQLHQNAARIVPGIRTTVARAAGTVIRMAKPMFTFGMPGPYFDGAASDDPAVVSWWDGLPDESPQTAVTVTPPRQGVGA